MNRVLCIWLPAWPIQRLVVARPELKSNPLVLHARDPRRVRRVVACCARAGKLGVTSSMPLAEVSALNKHLSGTALAAGVVTNDFDTKRRPATTPHAKHRRLAPYRSGNFFFCEHEPEVDHEALTDLAIWCEQFSPIVGLEDSEAPACLLLDVTGLAPIFGSETRLIEQVHREFQQRGYQIRVGIANTVGAAWAIAHYATDTSFCDGLSTPLNSRDVPSSTGLKDDHTHALLGSLPIEALRLLPETVDTLHQLGVETISQLLQLPRQGVAARFGERLTKRIAQAFGQHSEVIVAHRPRPQFEAAWILEHPTSRRDVIDTILQQLTEQVTQTLGQSNHAAVQVEAELKGKRSSRTLAVSLFQPSSNPKHIYDLFQLQLENSQMREPIQCVRLTAITTVRLTGEQHVLWNAIGHNRDHDVAQLVDRLSSRLGKECVFGVQAQAGALPEQAYRKKLLSDAIRSRRRKQATTASLRAPHRPLWLHDPPQQLSTTSLTTSANQPPAVFQFQNQQHRIVRHWGPERIETGWWRGQSVRRDYYRVETEQGYRFWLFRQLDTGAWFLHGCFE